MPGHADSRADVRASHAKAVGDAVMPLPSDAGDAMVVDACRACAGPYRCGDHTIARMSPSRRVIDGPSTRRSVPAVAAGKFDLRHDDIRRTRLEQIVQIAPALEDGLDLVRVAECTREGFGDQKMVVAEPQGGFSPCSR